MKTPFDRILIAPLCYSGPMKGKTGAAPPAARRHTYILRMWRDDDDALLQASLFNTATDERVGFGDARQLLPYLSALIETCNPDTDS